MIRASTLLVIVFLAAACASVPAYAQFTFVGGRNSVLGIALSAGIILGLNPTTTLTLGTTFTELLGIEPLVSVTTTHPLVRGWNTLTTVSYGGLGGDYRVNRLPEIRVVKGDRISTFLTYSVEVGFGYYTVRPTGVNGPRAHISAQVSTPALTLLPAFTMSAGVGYRQFFYAATPNAHGAGWGSVQFTWAPATNFSLSVSYLRQIPTSSSPLLFDAHGQESDLSAGISIRLTQAFALTHSQTYGFVSNSIEARVYGFSVALRGGHFVGLNYDDVPKTISLAYNFVPP